MDERALGLILRTRPLTETSLIVQWLTAEHGRISTVAKGARRPKSPFAGKLDLFYLAKLSFQRSRRSDLHALREVSVQNFHPALRVRLECLHRACYFGQLIELTTEQESPLPRIFELLASALEHLTLAGTGPLPVYAFELKLLAELGLAPDFAQSDLSAGARQVADHCLRDDWTALSHLRLGLEQDRELNSFLGRFIAYHCGRVPGGRGQAVHIGP